MRENVGNSFPELINGRRQVEQVLAPRVRPAAPACRCAQAAVSGNAARRFLVNQDHIGLHRLCQQDRAPLTGLELFDACGTGGGTLSDGNPGWQVGCPSAHSFGGIVV
jgi:hypothetical protein